MVRVGRQRQKPPPQAVVHPGEGGGVDDLPVVHAELHQHQVRVGRHEVGHALAGVVQVVAETAELRNCARARPHTTVQSVHYSRLLLTLTPASLS